MLNIYQLWLDDLYPRAKFADGLSIIEKLGHTKRVQMMRKEWIDEGKPKLMSREEEEGDMPVAEEVAQQDVDQMDGVQGGVIPSVEEDLRPDPENRTNPTSISPDEPDEDDLDALLAESNVPALPTNSIKPNTPAMDDDPFADAMEAIEGMDDMW